MNTLKQKRPSRMARSLLNVIAKLHRKKIPRIIDFEETLGERENVLPKRNRPMETSKITSEHKHTPLALANILFITWLCSLLWGGGIVFAIMTLAYIWQASYVINLIVGLTSVFFSPILLGASITHDWQRGIKAGISPFLAGISSFILTWIGIGIFYEWTNSWPFYFSFSLITSLAACATIITCVLIIKIHQYQYFELAVGAIIGIGISLIFERILGKSLLKDDEISHLFLQIPPLVWISVTYFSELLAGRSKWTDFLVWAFLTLISFGLPYIVVFLLSVD